MWSTLTTEEVLEEFSSSELSALNAVKGDSALQGITARVSEQVRGAVFAGGYALGEAGTIPDGLKSDAIAIARWKFLISVARNEALQTKERKEAQDKAEEKLQRVSEGKYAIEAPESASTTGGGTPTVNADTAEVTRTKLDGM